MTDDEQFLALLNECAECEMPFLYYLEVFAGLCESSKVAEAIQLNSHRTELRQWVVEHSQRFHFNAQELLALCAAKLRRDDLPSDEFEDYVVASMVAMYILGILAKNGEEYYSIHSGVIMMSKVIVSAYNKVRFDDDAWNDLYRLVYCHK